MKESETLTDKKSYGVVSEKGKLYFTLFASGADKVDVCFFDEDGALLSQHGMVCAENVWSISLPENLLYTRYAYALYRNGEVLYLADPFAKNMDDLALWRAQKKWPCPVARTVVPNFDWQGDTLPRVPLHATVIYEAHVKGLTKLFPEVPAGIRGTYLGICHTSLIQHLKNLGVTTLELLPVHGKSEDVFLKEKNLTNYWGYNTLAYFAPESEYALNSAITEFKTMVRFLHKAGIEVILDVVYNHTGEGGKDARAISFRGLAENTYYRTDEAGRYIDYTACGNTLDTDNPHTLEMVLESLRYWANEMHVDGFRFDLAPTLFRRNGVVDFTHELNQKILADPVLGKLKLIAEPWDLGEGGYQRGKFPEPWLEWNDVFRDSARKFWKGDGYAHDLMYAMANSTLRSVNFFACHDGFTLHDLVSYEKKRNEANGEDNRDGADHNFSFNCGEEGESKNPVVLELRMRQMRNFWLTLAFAQGIPMVRAGDEIASSQQGNNNAYAQDNAISWIDWTKMNLELMQFVQELFSLRTRFREVSQRYGVRVDAKSDYTFELSSAEYKLFFNAAVTSTFFSIKGQVYKELLHTARNVMEEPIYDVLYLPPQSAVVCLRIRQRD
ncbi:MAG: Glycogen operon protein GlgX [Turneriella sp.]|nr:Glycogen operon protein GlgX [Turneriella sp.]